MRFSLTTLIRTLSAAILAIAASGCGSASNNDQGTSFTLFGFFKSADATAGDSGQIIQLGTDTESNSAAGLAGGALSYLGLQNNLEGQGVRTQRVILSYFVEGATEQPPSTTQPVSVYLGPVATDTTTSTATTKDSSLPDGFNFENSRFVQVFVVPPDIMAWINLNRDKMPEAPFTMTAHVYVAGITTAGDSLDTNQMDYLVEFVTDNVIAPTGGSSSSASSSGATLDESGSGSTTDGSSSGSGSL